MPTPLRPGDPAPDFEGVTTEGKRVALKDFRGKKLVRRARCATTTTTSR